MNLYKKLLKLLFMRKNLIKNIILVFLLITCVTACNADVSEKRINNNNLNAEVVKIVDGDTIDVRIDGKIERVRLLAIDTPESVKPGSEIECFGEEASKRLGELLKGESVKLEIDKGQNNKDKYGRLLRYVYLEDGSFVNEIMIREGYAQRFYCHPRCEAEDILKVALDFAKKNSVGMWNEENCGK